MENDFQNEIEKIRKKTFNPELQKLVNGVLLKENDLPDFKQDKYTLLEQIHLLFYKSLNLSNAEFCNDTDFRYDAQSINENELDVSDLFIDKIVIMEYDNSSEIYKVTKSEFEEEVANQFIFCPSEKIYKKVFTAGKPVKFNYNFLSQNDIDERFLPLAKYDFFAVSFNTVLRSIWSRYVKFSNTFDFSKFNPVILFSVKKEITEELFLKKYLISFYLRLYDVYKNTSITRNEITDIRIALERYSKEMSVFDDASLFILKINCSFSNEFYFLLKFLKNKLEKTVINSARITLVNLKCITAFINNADVKKFIEEVDDFNHQYDNCIEIIRYKNFQKNNINRILREIKLL